MKLLVALLITLIATTTVWLIKSEKTEWTMPKELNEVSGICFFDDHTLACVQDEKGIIYLYDLKKSEVLKEIKFAGKGDYEGIALVNNTAYIIEGNGILYEVADFMTNPSVTTYTLALKEKEESEAVCYDAQNNRLLFAFKSYKKYDVAPQLFAFDLVNKKMLDSAVLTINLEGMVLRKKDRDNARKIWEPADIAINAVTRTICVIDAINGHLMELSPEGTLLNLELISSKKIHHPEGIAITPSGTIYLCNDANNEGKGKIIKWKN